MINDQKGDSLKALRYYTFGTFLFLLSFSLQGMQLSTALNNFAESLKQLDKALRPREEVPRPGLQQIAPGKYFYVPLADSGPVTNQLKQFATPLNEAFSKAGINIQLEPKTRDEIGQSDIVFIGAKTDFPRTIAWFPFDMLSVIQTNKFIVILLRQTPSVTSEALSVNISEWKEKNDKIFAVFLFNIKIVNGQYTLHDSAYNNQELDRLKMIVSESK